MSVLLFLCKKYLSILLDGLKIYQTSVFLKKNTEWVSTFEADITFDLFRCFTKQLKVNQKSSPSKYFINYVSVNYSIKYSTVDCKYVLFYQITRFFSFY